MNLTSVIRWHRWVHCLGTCDIWYLQDFRETFTFTPWFIPLHRRLSSYHSVLQSLSPSNLCNTSSSTGPVTPRPHPASEQPGNSIGLEAIIRKALMGKYDDQPEERSPSNLMGSGGVPAADGRGEDFFSQGATPSDILYFNVSFTPIYSCLCCSPRCNWRLSIVSVFAPALYHIF